MQKVVSVRLGSLVINKNLDKYFNTSIKASHIRKSSHPLIPMRNICFGIIPAPNLIDIKLSGIITLFQGIFPDNF